jgi:hypothetical protein
MAARRSFGLKQLVFSARNNQKDVTRIIGVLACEVPDEAFPDLHEADILGLLSSLAAELAEESLEQLTGPREPDEKKILVQLWRVLS